MLFVKYFFGILKFFVLDSSNMFQVFDYNSLTDEQKLSIEGVQVLLNTCLYNGKNLIVINYISGSQPF